jgi:hypothetical protein
MKSHPGHKIINSTKEKLSLNEYRVAGVNMKHISNIKQMWTTTVYQS